MRVHFEFLSQVCLATFSISKRNQTCLIIDQAGVHSLTLFSQCRGPAESKGKKGIPETYSILYESGKLPGRGEVGSSFGELFPSATWLQQMTFQPWRASGIRGAYGL